MALHMKSHVAEVTPEREEWPESALADIAPEFATDPFLKRPRG